ncbi:MAG: hypothetical protein LBG96_10205 [Tannerella sp.]|jgi:16S rRNA G966 N2-methylase RsmD|nr:hypothetical protein [Tannerella sp.]
MAELQKSKEKILADLDNRVKDKILEPSNAELLKKLINNAESLTEEIAIAELGTTYKRTGLHFDKRLEKLGDTVKYFKRNAELSFSEPSDFPQKEATFFDGEAVKEPLTHKLIIGDNYYDALLNLLVQYRGAIDVIYIDPPYGKDSLGEFFLVSSLSKGDLARQNYEKFCDYADRKFFANLNSHLINSEIAGEERLFILILCKYLHKMRLKDLSTVENSVQKVKVGKRKQNQSQTDIFSEMSNINEKEIFLWGKNYVPNSAIKFEYYMGALHSSFPDFVMKDTFGRVHIFEVKSVNIAPSMIDNNIYKAKIAELKNCYKQASKITEQIFYLSVLDGETWQITQYAKGKHIDQRAI